jgi:L-arabinose isomerase
MGANDTRTSGPRDIIQSFEVTGGEASGDLLSERRGDRPLTVGVLACAYFEYWRMYEGLQQQVAADMAGIAARLERDHQVAYPGLVDTLDRADAAGRQLRDQQVDLLVITEGTYCPDYIVHQALLHLPGDLPICVYASQAHDQLDFEVGYDQALRNSGPMGLAQLTAGFRKMGRYPGYEVVVGAADDEEAYREINRFVQVRTTIANLRHWNIGLVGHVFRGMYDFQYDKTAVTGKLGPHVIDLDLRHLSALLEETRLDDPRVTALRDKVRTTYEVVGLTEAEILRSARLAAALQELVRRYKLDGLALLGQHHIELQANAACYLGLAEMLLSDQALAVTEGDVLGLIMSKVLKDFTGHTPFFGEWEEVDTSRNAVLLLGHGFVDPREARRDRPVQVQPACEDWGFEGHSLGFQASYEPGPVSMSHVIEDPNGWRLLVSAGEILDVPPLKISESSMVVRVEKDVKRYLRELMKLGFAHHCIAAPGTVTDYLSCFAEQLGLAVCRL